MNEKTHYRPIKGSRKRGFFGGFSNLWMAADHLLLVSSSGWADRWKESYRRFYFRDIQALIVAENRLRRNWSMGLLLTALFFLAMAALFHEIGIFFHLPVALIVLLFFLVNWFKGPTCTTRIVTAVQATPLPCSRLGNATRLRKELTGAIEEQQGHFDTEHIEKLGGRLQELSTAKQQDPSQSDQSWMIDEPIPLFNNLAHIITFTLFIVQAIISALSLGGRGQLLYFTETILFLVTLVSVTMALYYQSRSRIKGALVKLTWVSMAWLVGSIILNFGLLIEVITTRATDMAKVFNNDYELWLMMGQIDPADSLYLRLLLTTRVVCFSLLGIGGLLLSLRFAGKNADD